MRLVRLPGVFRPPSDCRLLAAVMRDGGYARDAAVLDLCTGSGALAIAAAREGAAEVTATDVSRRAVLTTRANARRDGVDVRALRGDLFAPVVGRRFDLILSNPPYLPGPVDPPQGAARAWEGGPDGRRLVRRICAEAPGHLSREGTLLITHSSLTGEDETLAALGAAGLRPRVVARERGPLGPIAAARAARLVAAGALGAGERHEDIIVVAATPAER